MENSKSYKGLNQISGKISEVVVSAKKSVLMLVTEKDLMKFHHANHLENLENLKINFKLLSSISENTSYIFDDMSKAKIKKIPSGVHDNLCFLIKDGKEIVHFIKNANQASQQMNAMWTDSKTLAYSMKTLFDLFWSTSENI